MSFNRVLPKPLAYCHDPSRRDFPAHTSTPYQHKIMTDGSSAAVNLSRDDGHRPTALELRNQRTIATHASSVQEAPITSAKRPPVTDVAGVLASPVPRKRTISVMTSEPNRGERSSSTSSSRSASSKDSSLQFCLCQPEPKIPRPPNAFLLFRQHSQRDVSAQNPGMPNPQISQIIGEMWQKLSKESQQEWKNLAEEVKARHRQQYPGYKYQPRRRGRNQTAGNTDTSGTTQTPCGTLVCNRCGGRVMNPPLTPTTPLTPPTPQTESSLALARSTAPGQAIQPGRDQRELKPFRPMNVNTGADWRSLVSKHVQEENTTFSPGKRRRFNGNGTHDPYGQELSPGIPFSPRATPPPPAETSRPGGSHIMLPPARTYQVGGAPETHDPSLTLPPLRATAPSRQDQDDVETMVMAIPFINKIKTLAMVSPPLSSRRTCRGAVVSVEGQDTEAVKYVLQYIHEHFAKAQVVRIFEGPQCGSRQYADGSGDVASTTEQYLQYHRTISSWLSISGEIADFMNQGSVKREVVAEVPPAPVDSEAAEVRTDATTERKVASTDSGAEPIRIALISRYQLTTTDSLACMTPIKDSYGPMDHWQWMASLWRGCVGPDITVLIRDCETEEIEKFGGGNPVENRLDDSLTLVIRRAAGSSVSIEERALRRVAFEVDEILRK